MFTLLTTCDDVRNMYQTVDRRRIHVFTYGILIMYRGKHKSVDTCCLLLFQSIYNLILWIYLICMENVLVGNKRLSSSS